MDSIQSFDSNNENQQRNENILRNINSLTIPKVNLDVKSKSVLNGLQYLEFLLETEPFPFSSDRFGINRSYLTTSSNWPQFAFADLKEQFNQYLLVILLQQHLPSNFRKKLIQRIRPKKIELLNFFGNTDIKRFPNDQETSSICYHALLKTNAVSEKEILTIAMDIYKNVNDDGVNQVYVVPKEHPRYNRLDAVSIINMLQFAYALRHEELVRCSEDYVFNWLNSGNYKTGTLYYPSPYTFLYFCSQLASMNHQLKSRFMSVLRMEFANMNKELKYPLDYALNILTGVQLGVYNEKLVEKLMDMQNEDGRWPADALYITKETKIYFGSKALSTMFAVLALIEIS